MVKTTLYLPTNLKHRLAQAARQSGQSEAEFIRTAIEAKLSAEGPAEAHFGRFRSDDPTLAERVDEVLAEGFGQL